MFKKAISIAVFLCALTGVAQNAPVCSDMTLGVNGALNGFVPSPNDAWHQDITTAPLDPNSTTIITSSADLAGSNLHPDFGSIANGDYGIPYTVVDTKSTPEASVAINLYPAESDLTLYPLPTGMTIEDRPGECPGTSGDRHAIVIDRNQCVAYEMYQAAHCTSGWSASSSALWDFSTTEKRPYGFTSVDAAGLSVFEGLIRYDEIVAGSINHAIRFTAVHTKKSANGGYFTAPATHAAGTSTATDNIMGMRIRLKADFDISGFSSTNQIILKAMKQYGMILADNGSNMFFQGTPDARWNDDDLSLLKAVPSSAFDVVQMNPVYDAGTAPTGASPVITSFTTSATNVAAGTSVTLTPTVTGASYSYIDKVGFIRGAVTVEPTETTTYMLTSRNAFGTSSASVTVTVNATTGGTPNLAFSSIADQTFGMAPFAVSASSQSSGSITYSVVSGPAKISGNMVTTTGAGTVVVKASQVAAGIYTATSTQASVAVAPGNPSLAFVAIANKVWSTATSTVSTTTKSSGSISYSVVSGPATISGNVLTLTGTGTVVLNAVQAAAGNYTTATATTSFTVTGVAVKLAFTAIPAQTFGNAPFAVSASSASSGAITYSVVSGPATISGKTVTLTGAGTVTLQASQAAAGGYSAGTTTVAVNVAQKAVTLTLQTIPDQTFGNAPFNVTATSISQGAISYVVLSGSASITGNTLTLSGKPGTITVRASQASTANYLAAIATTSFNLAAETVTLNFIAIPAHTYGNAPFTVKASSASWAPVVYSVVSGPATISGSTVTLTGPGTVTLGATQAATSGFAAAATTTSFDVAAAVAK